MRASSWVLSLAMLPGIVAGARASGTSTVALLPRTTAAYDAYVAKVEQAFLIRARAEAPVAPVASGRHADCAADGRIIRVPQGLVHHWRATTHIPDVTLDRVIATAQRYDAYTEMYASVVTSRLLHRGDGHFRVLTRVRERVGGVTVVLEVRSLVRYERAPTSAFSIGAAEHINEVEDVGLPGEHLVPAGRDSGYLWRASTLTRFVERGGGVDVELETIGLSRRFPPLLGWLIEPIARRLGRRSVERTLMEFATAVTGGAADRPPTSAERR